MPYTLKPNKLLVKDPNGSGYLPQNVVTERTTSEMVSDITAAGNTEITAIRNEAAQLDSKIDEADTAISKINALPGIIAGLRDLLDLVHPVGSVYISFDSTNPGQLFGGTWEQIKGRFLLSTGIPDDNTNSFYGTDLTYDGTNKYNESTPGSTGGESRHTLSVNEMPEHSHYAKTKTYEGNDGWTFAMLKGVPNYVGVWSTRLDPTNAEHFVFGSYAVNGHGLKEMDVMPYIGAMGDSQGHNNLPPYMAVNMWRRTA